MIVTVTPNPAVDMTWTVPRLTIGHAHRTPTAVSRAGGKGVNVARVLATQGVDVLAIAPVGGSTGALFSHDLVESRLPHRLVPISAATRRTAAIVDDMGAATTLNEVGQPLSADEWGRVAQVIESALADASVLVVSGSLPLDTPPDLCARFIALARERGIPTIVDTSGPALLAAAAAGADILKPNLEEALEATGAVTAAEAAESLLDRGAGLVMLSLGAEGMVAVSRQDRRRPLSARLSQALVGNATGAGDAAVAALAAQLARGEHRVEPLLRAATAWSAAAVLMPLAGEISPRHAELANELLVIRPVVTSET